jgi:methylated-DNA-[protein]-cysteine S-methyltransferase
MSTRPVEQRAARPARRRGDGLRWRAYQTPWGEGLVGADREGLRFVDLPTLGAAPEGAASGRAASEADAEEGLTPAQEAAFTEWVGALDDYFAGVRLEWSAEEIPWDELGVSPFERAVYEALLTVPAGQVVSYGELAEMAGRPRAARAVGTAMATNPLPIIIPCHRVVRSDGSLGNYGDDPRLKPLLLEHERAAIARGGEH